MCVWVGGGDGQRGCGWEGVWVAGGGSGVGMEMVDGASGRTYKKIQEKEKSKKENHTCSRTKVHE